MVYTIVHIAINKICTIGGIIMNLNYVQIGNRIREARIAAKLSQATLAELADTSPQYISHIENGRKKASLSSLVSIASAPLCFEGIIHSIYTPEKYRNFWMVLAFMRNVLFLMLLSLLNELSLNTVGCWIFEFYRFI